MKKYTKSTTLWLNALFFITPAIIELLSFANIEVLKIIGINNAEQVYKILYLVVLPLMNMFLRFYKTYLPLSNRSTGKLIDYIGDDMYQFSLDRFRTSQPLFYSDFENLWILVNCPGCISAYLILQTEVSEINHLIDNSGHDPNTFNADKKPYPKGKY